MDFYWLFLNFRVFCCFFKKNTWLLIAFHGIFIRISLIILFKTSKSILFRKKKFWESCKSVNFISPLQIIVIKELFSHFTFPKTHIDLTFINRCKIRREKLKKLKILIYNRPFLIVLWRAQRKKIFERD